MPELSGLDVYEGQGMIDWTLVPELTFVAAKASQYRADRMFSRNWSAMRERAFPVRAAYHFVTTEPAGIQARRFRDIVGELLPGEVPALDYEPTDGIPVLERAFALEVRDAVEDAFGREALIYVGAWYANAASIIAGRPWWFPSYGVSEARARSQAFGMIGLVPHVWQWGGGGEGADVPGVTPGARDDSNSVLRPSELIGWAGGGTPHTPAATPATRSSTMLKMINVDGREEIVGLSPDGSLVSSWETSPGSGIGNFRTILPASAPKFSGIFPTAGPTPDGRLAVRLAGPAGVPYGAWQNGPGGGWQVFTLAELTALSKG